MNEPERREMIEGYLRRLARGLEEVPAASRQDLTSREAAQRLEETVGLERHLRPFVGRALAFYGFLGAPLTSASYLALRLRRGARRHALLLPVAVGVIVGVMLLVLFLSPEARSSGRVRAVPLPASASCPAPDSGSTVAYAFFREMSAASNPFS